MQGGTGQLSWTNAGNTAGFGHAINDGRPFWIGRFTAYPGSPFGTPPDRDQVLFYAPEDGNWWLGTWMGIALDWALVGNTDFGYVINDGRPFFTGRFTNSVRDEIAFYYPGDGNWWVGG